MMDELSFSKYKGFWVLTSYEQADEGLYLAAPPVRIIPHADGEKLKQALLELLEEDAPVVPRRKFFDNPYGELGLVPTIFGLKRPRAYLNRARSFHLKRTEEHLSIEEWRREKGAWVADEPIWQRKFKLGEMEKLVKYLIKKTE
jgi:hypothetical protein